MNHARLSFKTDAVSPSELVVPPGACIIHISHGSFLTWMHRQSQTFSYARHADIGGNGGILPLILNFEHYMGWPLNLTLRPLYLQRKSLGVH
jgi:hypothetical protein